MRRGLAVFALCVVAAGCAEEGSTSRIRVSIDSDLAIGTELTRLEVEVTDEAEDSERVLQSEGIAVSDGSLPATVDIDERGGMPSPLRVIVRGFGQENADSAEVETARQEILVRFDPQNTVLLEMYLAQTCFSNTCDGQPLDSTCDAATALCAPVVTATGLTIVE